MSQEARLTQLNQLLTRVQTRAGAPRPAGQSTVAAQPAPVVAAAPGLELDEAFGQDAAPPAASSRPVLQAAAPPSAAAPSSADFEELEDLGDIEEVDGAEIDLEEPAPESHSSPVAGTMEQALASAAEAPPRTPPPESGAEPTQHVHVPPHRGPTMEQLGETISLEEGPSRAFELDEPLGDAERNPSEAPASSGQLEADLPISSLRGYEDKNLNLQSPPEARAELERVRLGQPQNLEAEVVQRPLISTNVVDFVGAHQSFAPESFAQLLDASLAL